MSKVSEALEPWVYDPMYKGDDAPDQPDPNEGKSEPDCCDECDWLEAQVDGWIDNQIKESKLEKSMDGWRTNEGGDGTWIDPAGGIHDDNDDDPARLYE